MKRLVLITVAMASLAWQTSQAQSDDECALFKHFAIGASMGTEGLGLDVAAAVTPWATIRAGINFFPKVKYKDTYDINDNNPIITDDVDIEGKVNVFDYKILADLYPFKSTSFHFTTGLYMGKSSFITASNTSMFISDPKKYGKVGLMLGDYRITTDDNGYISADVKINKVKPYLGIGFGRTVPRKRVGVACDLGVMFWGKPRLGAMTKDDWGETSYHVFKSSDLDEYDDKDLKDALKTMEKINVYPVINIRICGRIL